MKISNEYGYQPKEPDIKPNPPKCSSAVQKEVEKPMNPYAAEDFKNAVNEASTKLGEDLKRIGEQMKTNADYGKISFLDFDDMPTEYCGTMRLNYVNGLGAWQDVMFTLIAHGYEVTARLEDATETEKELDGADKFVVIEYEEVE